MSLFNSLSLGFVNLFNGKDSYTQTNFSRFAQMYSLSKGEYKIDTSINGLNEIATTTAHLSAVLVKRSNMLANGRWREYKLQNGKKVLVEKSDAVNILENPNPLQNGNELLRQICWSYDVYGNTMINLNRLSLNLPQSMYVLPMSDLTIERTNKLFKQNDIDDIVKSIYIQLDGSKEYFERKNLVHFKTSNPNDPLLGISPIEELKMPIANVRAAMGFRNRIINNDGALGVLSGGAVGDMSIGLDDKSQERIQASYKGRYGMQAGKNDIIMSETPVQWTAMSYPTKDLMLFEEVDQDFKIIIDHYGLNDNIFSRDKASTFSNYTQGLKAAYQDCIIPFAEDIALGFTKSFGMDGISNWLELDYSHLEVLQEDEKAQSENLKRNIESAKILFDMGKTKEADTLVQLSVKID